MARLHTGIIAFLALLSLTTVARAQQTRDWDRFRFSAGAFFIDLDTKTEVESSRLDRGTRIDLEDDLGMESSQTDLFLSARYRFARKHSIAVGFLSIERNGDVTLTRDIQFGEDFFTINIDVESNFDFELLQLSYRYAFLSREKFDMAFSVGINSVDYDIALTALGGAVEGRENEKYPVPSLGLGSRFRFARGWSLGIGAAYFEYSTDDWEASFLVTDIDVEYFPWRHVGFGVGYNRLEIEYVEEGSDALDIDFTYDGIMVRAIVAF